jgi:hypothetical protein
VCTGARVGWRVAAPAAVVTHRAGPARAADVRQPRQYLAGRNMVLFVRHSRP